MNPDLSKREKEVCSLIKEGFTNQQIADKLFVCIKTIKFHITNIHRKKNVVNRHQLLVLLLKDQIPL